MKTTIEAKSKKIRKSVKHQFIVPTKTDLDNQNINRIVIGTLGIPF